MIIIVPASLVMDLVVSFDQPLQTPSCLMIEEETRKKEGKKKNKVFVSHQGREATMSRRAHTRVACLSLHRKGPEALVIST